MNWTYFLEHQKQSPFSSADIGICQSSLVLNINELVDSESVKLTFLSHSAFLNGEQIFSEWDINEKQLSLSTGELEPVVHVLEITVNVEHKVYKSRLALVPAPELAQSYIVIGSPRSGTTVVGNMVQQAFRKKAHGEAHIAELFSQLVNQSEEYLEKGLAANNKGTLVWEVPSIFLKAQLVKQLRETYSTYYGNEIIVDKTPGLPMLRALPLVMLAFPNAKVVYCQRRGIENISSRLRKFPKAKFEAHCKQWAQTVQVWQRLKKQLSNQTLRDDWWIEVEQYELATSPQKVTKELGRFLNVNERAITRMFEYQEKKSPQITGGKPSDVSSLDTVGWTKEQQKYFTEVCGEAMRLQGYSFDEQYYTTSEIN
ncbi:hypothetical protein AVL55_17315 [Alteromonas macleodii]|uniref:Sulfotransferase family protein n=1 Tax=Alteromonas macleodii TaxID=28108 RepID=A0A126Q5P4_ALTMA|nr:sulfotransferase [Alteromonas macleodii]AMJ99758.1 hypothetical protein AVL55_17315 [Alteromonas macleodii]